MPPIKYRITVLLFTITQIICEVNRKVQHFLIFFLAFPLFSCIIFIGEVIFLKYEIGSRIRLYRKQSGLTQEQLADKINVTKSRVSNWEQGINRPDADIIGGICRALNVSPSNLLDVHLSDEELSSHEKKVITAYRERADVQNAVDILLGIENK